MKTKKQLRREERLRMKAARRRDRQEAEWKKQRDTRPVVIKDREALLPRPTRMSMLEMAAFAVVAACIQKDKP